MLYVLLDVINILVEEDIVTLYNVR